MTCLRGWKYATGRLAGITDDGQSERGLKMKKNLPGSDALLIAICAKCLDCSGNARKLVERCSIADCPLYPYRSVQAIGEKQERQIDGRLDLFDVLRGMMGTEE